MCEASAPTSSTAAEPISSCHLLAFSSRVTPSSSSPSPSSESLIMVLLVGGIRNFGVRFARWAPRVCLDDLGAGAVFSPLSLHTEESSSRHLDVVGVFSFFPADRRLRFLPMVCPSSRRCCKSSACSLTSADDILTQRILPTIHPSCSVRMSFKFPMVDGLANAMLVGQPMILTLRPWTMLSS